MSRAFGLFLSLCFIVIPAAAGNDVYEVLEARDFRQPEAYQGRLVEVTAEVVSISVDSKTLRLYDAQSKALIGVSLSKLTAAERRAVILNPVHRLSVFGRAEVKNGRLMIEADKVKAQNLLGDGEVAEDVFIGGSEGNMKGSQ
jgi:hypothetical protein